MKNYKVKTKVIKAFNDSADNNKYYEENEPIILSRGRYEVLYNAGFVEKGEELKEKSKKIEKDEDNN